MNEGVLKAKKEEICGSLILLLVAFLWGVSFVFQSNVTKYMDSYSVLYLRSFIGIIALSPFLIFSLIKDKKNNIKRNKKDLILGPICCGTCLFLASLFQQLGLETTSAAKTGFITSLYIILVPIFALFLKKKCGINVYISVGIAVIGLLFLSFDFKEGFNFTIGDLLVFIGAIFFALQILFVDYFSKRLNVYYLSSFQLLTQGVIALVISLIRGITLTSFTSMFNVESTISILFMGVVSSAIAYTLQMVGQKYVNPTVSSIILSLESVFSAISAVIIYQFYAFSDVNQNMSVEEIIGSVIVFLAVILSQLPPSLFKFKKKKVEQEENK